MSAPEGHVVLPHRMYSTPPPLRPGGPLRPSFPFFPGGPRGPRDPANKNSIKKDVTLMRPRDLSLDY